MQRVSEEVFTLLKMMSPATCTLLAQIVPVFLLTFAVKGSFMTRAASDDVRKRPRRLAKRRWLKDPRAEWGRVVVLFLVLEFWLALASAGVVEMPAIVGWMGFALTLGFAAVEFWAAGVTTES